MVESEVEKGRMHNSTGGWRKTLIVTSIIRTVEEIVGRKRTECSPGTFCGTFVLPT